MNTFPFENCLPKKGRQRSAECETEGSVVDSEGESVDLDEEYSELFICQDRSPHLTVDQVETDQLTDASLVRSDG